MQLLSVSTRCRTSVSAPYLFLVGLPCPAERCLRRSPRRLGAAHIQVHLDVASESRNLHRKDSRPEGCIQESSYLGSCTLEAVFKAAKILKNRISNLRPRPTLQQTPPRIRLHLARCMNDYQRLGCKAHEKHVVPARKNLFPANSYSRVNVILRLHSSALLSWSFEH